MNEPSAGLTVKPVSPVLGAEITGFDLAAGVTDEQFACIQHAFPDTPRNTSTEAATPTVALTTATSTTHRMFIRWYEPTRRPVDRRST